MMKIPASHSALALALVTTISPFAGWVQSIAATGSSTKTPTRLRGRDRAEGDAGLHQDQRDRTDEMRLTLDKWPMINVFGVVAGATF